VPTNRKLCVGLLLDGLFVDKYVRDLINSIQAQRQIVLSEIVIKPGPDLSRSPANVSRHAHGLRSLSSHFLFRAIIWAESLLLRAYASYRDHYKRYDLRDLNSSAVVRAGAVGYNQKTNRPALDLVIDCSSGPPSSDGLCRSRLGIISLRYADCAAHLRCPDGFWECFHRDDATGFAIVKRADEGAEATVVRVGNLTTQFFYSLNQAYLYTKSYEQLKDVVQAVATNDSLAGTGAAKENTKTYSWPRSRHLISYSAKLVYRLAKKLILHALNIRQCWNISVIPEQWQRAPYWKSTAARLPGGRFWADPFLWAKDSKIWCFVEEFEFAHNRGHIAAIEIGKAQLKSTPVLVEDFHLSFPFVFQYKDEIFMCPESSEARQIRIYRAVEFPHRWQLVRIIMHDVCAADSMLFPKGDKWWMLTNIEKSTVGTYCEELYLFYANSPLDEEWLPHPRNPIKIDCRGGRNAGLIVDQGTIYRVGQRQGFDQYGEGLSVYKIECINKDVYKERLIWQISPDFRRGLLGVHHLSGIRDITAIDHVSWKLVLPHWPRAKWALPR
jgi:hypothetical protein